MLLTEQEKKRFVEYLEVEAYSSEGILKEMEKMKAPKVLIQEEKLLALACRILIKRLNSGESFSIEHPQRD